ncbi:MAG: cyclic pyranopterin monophosphate synthase MoaC [Bacteroidales bacterium]
MTKLTHTNAKGNAQMVDISGKKISERIAVAKGFIQMQKATLQLIRNNELRKGDVLQVARLAGLQGAKKTSDLIFLAHSLNLTHTNVTATIEENGVSVVAECKISDKTGVEMESLTAVNIALLNIYDMCKGVDSNMIITDIHLVSKEKTEQ